VSTAEPEEQQPEEQQLEEPGEEPPAPMSERTARAILGAVGLMAAWGVVVAVPEAAYFVAGLGAAHCCRKGRAWIDRRREAADEEAEEPDAEPVDVVEQLHTLSAGKHHVLLTRLAAAAGLTTTTGKPDTKAVRGLLDEAGVEVAGGVRTPHGNGPGVRLKDIPPPLSPDGAPAVGRCLCSSGANANANNEPEEGPREGFRVEPIGQAGTVVHDPAEAHRHQPVRAH
jgi:hypothetical protein